MIGGLQQFVSAIKSKILSKNTVYVIGNESADMDSVCSAILCSYLITQTSKEDKYVPLLNLQKRDLRLRPDIPHLLQLAGLSPDSLLYADDVKLTGDSRLFLVDHNMPTVPGKVEGIIDHHDIEGTFEPGIEPLVIHPSGSCASLIFDYFKDKVDKELLSDAAINALFIAPLVLDTKNMKNKVTQFDLNLMEFLKTSKPISTEIPVLFKTLNKLKSNISNLSASDILRKDYKKWGSLGISSIPEPICELWERDPSFPVALAKWRDENNLTLCVALGHGSINKVYMRDIAVSTNLEIEKVIKALEPIGLMNHKTVGNVHYFTQVDITATRKQVAPALRGMA